MKRMKESKERGGTGRMKERNEIDQSQNEEFLLQQDIIDVK